MFIQTLVLATCSKVGFVCLVCMSGFVLRIHCFPTEILAGTLVVPFKQVLVHLWMQMGMQQGVVFTQSLLAAHQAASVISCG